MAFVFGVLAVLLLWASACLVLLTVHARVFWRYWCEPVFRCPILILESDDWGAGPLVQAAALNRLALLLQGHRDRSGHPAVMTLALILSVPDGVGIRASGNFMRLRLDAPPLRPVLESLRRGEELGVFSLQLHGLEHFWPASVMASHEPQVQAWCRQPGLAWTEELPSHLQSRWVDASSLPSSFHATAAIRNAVVEEIAAYRDVIGAMPRIVVPPTFVWTREVEAAWAAQGVRWIVTPGCRYTARDHRGSAGRTEGAWFNGQGRDGIRYLVRTDYFEPKKGRDAKYALAALARDGAQGRPCLLENHRDNFCQDEALARHAESELDALLHGAVSSHRELRFLSTAELCAILDARDSRWIIASKRARLPMVWARVRHSGRLWKLMRWCGLAWLGARVIEQLAHARPQPQPAGKS